MKRIYIAGPMSADNILQVLANLRQGIEASAQLILAGYAVFCPMWDFQTVLSGSHGQFISERQIKAHSMAWVGVSDAMLCLPGWEKSKGTLAEYKEAVRWGVPVYRDLDELVTEVI